MDIKETLKELIVGNQNRPPAEVIPRSWEVPTDTGKAVTLPGVRRSGKSSHLALTQRGLLRRGVPKEHILSLNLDDERLDFPDGGVGVIWEAYRELRPDIPAGGVYIFLDEIQVADGWERFVRRMVKEFSGMPKYYAIDKGFKYALQGSVSEDRGAFLENAVYLHLRRRAVLLRGERRGDCGFAGLEVFVRFLIFFHTYPEIYIILITRICRPDLSRWSSGRRRRR